MRPSHNLLLAKILPSLPHIRLTSNRCRIDYLSTDEFAKDIHIAYILRLHLGLVQMSGTLISTDKR
jgi:hypothetical protein